MKNDVKKYISSQSDEHQEVCKRLYEQISKNLPDSENKVWHGHPVWFLDGNPTVGFSIQKPGVRLMFWSGADFDETGLKPGTGKFKDASVFYNSIDEINTDDLRRWLDKSQLIQWDYKNLVKRKGKLERILQQRN